MIDLVTHKFKYLSTGKITPEEYFMNSYVYELYESEQLGTSTKLLSTILDAKYENIDLNKFMKNKFQNLIEEQKRVLFKLLQFFLSC